MNRSNGQQTAGLAAQAAGSSSLVRNGALVDGCLGQAFLPDGRVSSWAGHRPY
jgi:hypothetical protein